MVYRLPDGLSKQAIESRIGEDLHLVYAMTTTWESIGVSVHRGEVGSGPRAHPVQGLAAALTSAGR